MIQADQPAKDPETQLKDPEARLSATVATSTYTPHTHRPEQPRPIRPRRDCRHEQLRLPQHEAGRSRVANMRISKAESDLRWVRHLRALVHYYEQTGTTRVPSFHTVDIDGTTVRLGEWAVYLRQRYRAGRLSPAQVTALEALGDWSWGLQKRGPRIEPDRDNTIRSAFGSGINARTLASTYGLSRQRIHQIVKAPKENAL